MAMGRNILSTTAILLVVIGMFCTIMLIFEKTDIVRNLEYTEWYKTGAALSSVIAVLFISYLVITSSNRSQTFKIFIVLILIAGVVAEFIFTSIFTDLSPQYPTYMVIIFNFLLRLYILVQLIQEPWTPLSLTSSVAIPTITNTLQPAVPESVIPAPISAKVERIMDEDANKFRNQFKEIVNQARIKVGRDNFDEVGKNKAYPEVIDPAARARDFSKDRLKDAAKYLKDKSGNIIDVVFGGGRRKR